jgi:glutaminyl-peptide cyclotransferase
MFTVFNMSEATGHVTPNTSLSPISTFFNTTAAYETIAKQIQLGPRIPGSTGIEKTRLLLEQKYNSNDDWVVNYQNFTKLWIDDVNVTLVNIIYTPTTLNESLPYFILLAHYDTRLWADKDPNLDLRKNPVPGANDGASGVAIALELGQILIKQYNISNFKIILFDGEDQGGTGWNWLEGSRFFVESQDCEIDKISYAILLDMVGGINATFKREGYSDQYSQSLLSKLWNIGIDLGHQHYFLNKSWIKIIDDHLPFLEKGVPAVDIIDDFSNNYKAWHTTSDNLDQISTETLFAVGETLETFIVSVHGPSQTPLTFPAFTFQTPIELIAIISSLFLKTYIRKKLQN